MWADEQAGSLVRGVAIGANGPGNGTDCTDLHMTYHPRGDQTSAQWFHRDEWLSFNMLRGGYCRRWPNLFGLIDRNHSEAPAKPFLDGEPIYEHHPYCWKPADGFSTPHDVRRNAYWSAFGGAAGHTYGHHAVWQFLAPGRSASLGARGTWTEAIEDEGAAQMRHVRSLLESRPYLDRVPDQTIITSEAPGSAADAVRGTRATDGAYLMVDSATGTECGVDTTVLSGDSLHAWWYDPRTGTAIDAGSVTRESSVDFFPPATGDDDAGLDRVLVVDDAARGFGPPGTAPAA